VRMPAKSARSAATREMIAYNRRQQLIADAHVAAAAAKAAAAPAVGGSVHQGFAGARLPVAAAVSPVAVDASVWDENDQQQQRPGQAAPGAVLTASAVWTTSAVFQLVWLSP
jgi:hypothetical protein